MLLDMCSKGDDLGSNEGSDSEPLGPPRVDTDGNCDAEALAKYISQLLSAYPRTDKMYEDVSAAACLFSVERFSISIPACSISLPCCFCF
jgi:hypothetical protein